MKFFSGAIIVFASKEFIPATPIRAVRGTHRNGSPLWTGHNRESARADIRKRSSSQRDSTVQCTLVRRLGEPPGAPGSDRA